jgi:hypothetical protein
LLIIDPIGHVAHIEYREVTYLRWDTHNMIELTIAILKKELSKNERREIVKAKIRMNHKP